MSTSAKILNAFELAATTEDENECARQMTFVLVGAGPSGVELAGSLAHLVNVTLRDNFHRIDPSKSAIILLDAGKRVLPTFAESVSRKVAEVGAIVIFGGILCQVAQLYVSIRTREQRGDLTGDPWNGRTLEWSTSSPPPAYNFAVLPKVAQTNLLWGPGIPVGLIVLAFAQIGVHLVFFLHLGSGPDSTNNILALAFGVGSVWIIANLQSNMMPMPQ